MIFVKNKTFKIVVVGGDNRQLLLQENLIEKGYNSYQEGYNCCCNYDNIFSSDVLILPIVATKDETTLYAPNCNEIIELDYLISGLTNCKYIICGKLPKTFELKLINKDINIFNYTNDVVFKSINAVPTAEGAVSIAISNTPKTLCGANCLVIGNGCIGKELVKILKGIGSNVTVSARKELDFAWLWSENINYINTNSLNEQELRRYSIIFNTVPKRIISHQKMLELTKEQLVIDLASLPYGFDHEKNMDYKCKLLLSSSLPAIYAPETSANATIKVIENYLKEVLNNGKD